MELKAQVINSVSDVPIWRYLSLAKYVDMLRTQSLFCPKASLFQDDNEGKWWGHSHLYVQAELWRPSPDNRKVLEGILERAGDDQAGIRLEIDNSLPTVNEWVRRILDQALQSRKPREVLKDTISTWHRLYLYHNESVPRWRREAEIFRESTYISCWNRANSMSLAMWEMNGGGRESIAIRSTMRKLEGLLEANAAVFDQFGLEGGVAEVEYLNGLKCPNEEVQERIYEIVHESGRDLVIGLFSIKPSIFYFEEEIRAIIYPKRDLLELVADPHPDMLGVPLTFSSNERQGLSLARFIDGIHLHPMLGDDSMVLQAVKEINRRFDVAEIPVDTDRIQAMGGDVVLPPVT